MNEKFSPEDINIIEEGIGISFKSKDLLTLALTHRSFVNENKDLEINHNERLEFLGDAVLELIVSNYLFHLQPDLKEGELSAIRSKLVDASSCCYYIKTLGIGDFLLLGKGEQRNTGRGRDTIYSDLFEAILGAVYLDQGFDKAEEFFLSNFQSFVLEEVSNPSKNYKALLQDVVQKNYQKQPEYQVINEEGPDHEKTFHVKVHLLDKELGNGRGNSKKEAEQMAAKDALEKFHSEDL